MNDRNGSKTKTEAKWGNCGVGWIETKAIEMALADKNERRHRLHKSLLPKILAYRGASGLMNPSAETLAKMIGWSTRSVEGALRDLKEWGVLEWKSGRNRSRRKLTNHYRIGPVLADLINQVGSSVRKNVGSSVRKNEVSPVRNYSYGQSGEANLKPSAASPDEGRSALSIAEEVRVDPPIAGDTPIAGEKEPEDKLATFRNLLERFCNHFNAANRLVFTTKQEKALREYLATFPETTKEQFYKTLVNYATSERVNLCETPAQFLPKLNKYAAGPLDEYGKPSKED